MENSPIIISVLNKLYQLLFDQTMIEFVPVMVRNYARREGEEQEDYYNRINDIFRIMGEEMAKKVIKIYPPISPEETLIKFREENPFSNLLEDDEDVFNASVEEWITNKKLDAEKVVADEYAAKLGCDAEIIENIFHLISLQSEIGNIENSS